MWTNKSHLKASPDIGFSSSWWQRACIKVQAAHLGGALTTVLYTKHVPVGCGDVQNIPTLAQASRWGCSSSPLGGCQTTLFPSSTSFSPPLHLTTVSRGCGGEGRNRVPHAMHAPSPQLLPLGSWRELSWACAAWLTSRDFLPPPTWASWQWQWLLRPELGHHGSPSSEKI